MNPADDLDRIMGVMATAFDPAFGEAWSRRQVEDSLLLGSTHYRLCDTTGDPPGEGAAACGFSLSRTGFGEEELLLFAIAPDHRGRGLGAQLLARFLADARERGAQRALLEMRRGNPAEALYRAQGFAPIGLRPNYYRTTSGTRIDAITFACDLTQTTSTGR